MLFLTFSLPSRRGIVKSLFSPLRSRFIPPYAWVDVWVLVDTVKQTIIVIFQKLMNIKLNYPFFFFFNNYSLKSLHERERTLKGTTYGGEIKVGWSLNVHLNPCNPNKHTTEIPPCTWVASSHRSYCLSNNIHKSIFRPIISRKIRIIILLAPEKTVFIFLKKIVSQ